MNRIYRIEINRQMEIDGRMDRWRKCEKEKERERKRRGRERERRRKRERERGRGRERGGGGSGETCSAMSGCVAAGKPGARPAGCRRTASCAGGPSRTCVCVCARVYACVYIYALCVYM
jgi:hypothetical protein